MVKPATPSSLLVAFTATAVLCGACQTPSRAEADHAVSRTPNQNPNDKRDASQRLTPHAPPVKNRAAQLLHNRLDAIQATLVRTLELRAGAEGSAALLAPEKEHLATVATALGLAFSPVGTCGAQWSLPSERGMDAPAVLVASYVDQMGAQGVPVTVEGADVVAPGAAGGAASAVAMMYAAAAWRDARLPRPVTVMGYVGADHGADWACVESWSSRHGTAWQGLALDGAFPVNTSEMGLGVMKAVERAHPPSGAQTHCVPQGAPAGDQPAFRLACPTRELAVQLAAGLGPPLVTQSEETWVNVHVPLPPDAQPSAVSRAWSVLADAVVGAPAMEPHAAGMALLAFVAHSAPSTGPPLWLDSAEQGVTVDVVGIERRADLWLASLRARLPPGLAMDKVVSQARQHAGTTLVVEGWGKDGRAALPPVAGLTGMLEAWTTVTGLSDGPGMLPAPSWARLLPHGVGLGPQPQPGAAPGNRISSQQLLVRAQYYALVLQAVGAAHTARASPR